MTAKANPRFSTCLPQSRQLGRLLLAAALFVAAGTPAVAGVVSWDINGTTAGAGGTAPAGTWDATNAYWNSDSTGGSGGTIAAWQSGDAAVFAAGSDATGTYNVTVSGTQVVTAITFEEGTARLNNGTSGVLQFSGGATFTKASAAGDCQINIPVQGNGQLVLNGSGSFGRLNGVVSDSGGTLDILVSSANWVFGGQHTFSGGLEINGGYVVPTVSSTGAAGAPTSGPFGTGTLTLTAGLIRPTSGGAITIGNAVSLNGNFTFGDNSTTNSLTFSGPLTLTGNHTLTTNYSNIYFSGVLGDGGNGYGFTKSGTSALILSGNNTFTGGVTISNGTLTLGNTSALNSTTPNAVTFADNSNTKTLRLNGYSTTVSALNTGATVGTSIVENGASTAATLTVNTTAMNTFAGVLQNGGTGTLALAKSGTGTLTLSGANTYTGGTTVGAGTLQLGASDVLADTGTVTISGGTLALGAYSDTVGGLTLTSGSVTGSTGVLTASSYGVQAGTVSAVLGGSGALSKTTSGTVILSGSAANTYTGGTTVSAGQLTLSKSSGVNAVPGDLNISTGGKVNFTANNQIADTAAITLSTAGSVLNGTGVNAGVFNVQETFGSLTVTGGAFNTGGGGNWTVTGAASFTGGGNTIFVGNSGSISSFGSLSLTNMTATAGSNVSTNNSFTLYGNSTGTRSTITVGSGGLTLDNSVLNLRRGSSGTKGSRLILNGDVTTTGTSASAISEDTNGGTGGEIGVELSSTAGDVVRTFNIGGGGADLAITVPIGNGAATTAGITKTGAGTLTLGGANTYNGDTTISEGTLALTTAGSISTSPNIILDGGTLDVTAKSGVFHLLAGQTLQGTGTVSGGLIVDSSAHVAPGTSPGTLYTDDITFSTGSFFDVEITSTGYDSLDVTGLVDLDGATLTLDVSEFPSVGTSYTIINNDDVDAVIDTFNGLAEGAFFYSTGTYAKQFMISYVGGDGNDVVLTAVPEPSALAMLAGLGGVALLGWLKRRKRS